MEERLGAGGVEGARETFVDDLLVVRDVLDQGALPVWEEIAFVA